MKGFRDFLIRGNLLELAVAFIMGAAFNDLVKSFAGIFTSAISKIVGGAADFSEVAILGVNVGQFLTALLSFVLMATVLYFGLVKPLTMLRERFGKKAEEEAAEEAKPTEQELLTEIRDLLSKQSAAG